MGLAFLLANILADSLLLIDLRKLVYSFLLSKRNIKSAKKIHNQQAFWHKVTLDYIREYAIYPKEFRFCQKALVIYMISILPQYVSFVIMLAILPKNTLIITMFVICIIKFVLLAFLYAQFNESRVSRFDRRYK